MPRNALVAAGAVAALLVILALWLIVGGADRQSADDAELRQLESQSSRLNDLMQAQLSESVSGQVYDDAHERMDSPLGQALSRRCSDWTDFFDNQPGEEARGNRDRACAELREYVNSGKVPDEYEDRPASAD